MSENTLCVLCSLVTIGEIITPCYHILSECSVLSELQVFLIVGEFYQNWTSPDITTAAVAQAATKSFVEGAKLHSNLISFPKLDLPLCFLGSRIIEVPTPPPPTEESTLSPTLIAVIVVVLFLFIALCIMVACICCYCYYARKDKKEADK